MQAEVVGRDEIRCTCEASAAEIAKRMRKFHVGELVVVEPRGGRLVPVGIVTEHDLVERVLAEGVAPETITAADLMHRQAAEAVYGVKGRVAWMTDGYGFIEDANGEQHYFDRNNVDDPRYEDLHVGMPVQFQADCTGGTKQALRVTAVCDSSAQLQAAPRGGLRLRTAPVQARAATVPSDGTE
ncbi:MAG TPA: CBS domain-containing protein [Burkholderiales bacterium]|nr:CBS domain-containing protein [Burkholderiales bacterium]